MRRVRTVAALALALSTSVLAAGRAAAAPPAPIGTCVAGLTIATTSTGTVRQAGAVTLFDDSGVGGQYTSGFLAGYTLSGAQDIALNSQTNQGKLIGSFVATSPDGKSTLRVRYTGNADLVTGAATGHFRADGGTGKLAGFRWVGDITAQMTSFSPPTFVATDSGVCRPPL
jgi:hypothetical protein